jgi:hypothetical protein
VTFINEYIPEEDLKKYNFEALNKRFRKAGSTPASYWVIDREADIWLRKFYNAYDRTAPDDNCPGISAWDFYWKGTLITLELETLEVKGGGRGTHCTTREKLKSINVPPELSEQYALILQDLETALIAYSDAGVLSSSSSFTLIFEVEGALL